MIDSAGRSERLLFLDERQAGKAVAQSLADRYGQHKNSERGKVVKGDKAASENERKQRLSAYREGFPCRVAFSTYRSSAG